MTELSIVPPKHSDHSATSDSNLDIHINTNINHIASHQDHLAYTRHPSMAPSPPRVARRTSPRTTTYVEKAVLHELPVRKMKLLV
jgi:hypothetical protein